MPWRRGAYRGVLLGYAGICALWIPLIAWMMPNDSFKVGVVYLMRSDWKFETRNRSGEQKAVEVLCNAKGNRQPVLVRRRQQLCARLLWTAARAAMCRLLV